MTSVSVNPPRTPVTRGSQGVAAATTPNVCKMPGPPAPFVPTPLPNIGKSGDSPDGYSTSVTIEGHPVAIAGASFGSMGDVASRGTGGGIVSNNVEGATKFIAPGSMNVTIEGKRVHLLGDQTSNNNGPGGCPPNAATLCGTIQCVSIPEPGGSAQTCPTCKVASGRTRSDAEPYDTFFSPAEKAELDAIAATHPDLAPMLPPKDAFYSVRANSKHARQQFEAKKKKNKMKGEYHHPHSLKTGGCPVHQVLVLKPDVEPEKSRVDAVDQQIQDVINRAQSRPR